ncbi:MAG: flagellin [Candidatus Fibromonas sp.]|jgi:flagellin|nr:flagellin [Candidatus Fibromonas sp.]
MQINHNVRAMVTQHALYSNNNAMTKSLEKLSTGLKINRAQDDAAGLAMSEQMRTQIRALGKAKQNSQDGIGALQIAEGGLAEITNLMQRQRELAIQSANDTLTSTERKYLDDEFQELSFEIGRIAVSTDYNGKNMLSNGTAPGAPSLTSDNSFGVMDVEGVARSFTLHVGANYSTNVGGVKSNQLAVTYAGINFKKNSTKLNEFYIGKYAATTTFSSFKNELVDFSTLSIRAAGGTYTTSDIYRAIDALDGAIKSISGTRAKIGTFINRLEYTINNIANLEFNTQDAESRIRDTDFSKETTNFTRNQIMVQASTSMLAQANSLPQAVLGLLG